MADAIVTELKKNHNVDEFFYPNISMNVDLPQGFEGELRNIESTLKKNGFAVNSETVFEVMNLKKHLLNRFSEIGERSEVAKEYKKMTREKETVGSIVPLDYFLVAGLVTVFLYFLKRFSGSFADEAGKLAARRLFGKDEDRRQLLREVKINKEEYNLITNEILVIVEEDNRAIEVVRKSLKKTARK